MLPGDGIGDADKTCYPGSPEYKFKYGSEGLNTNEIKEYIKNPHKFNIKPEMDGKYYNLWSTDNDKTDANDDVVIKSVYDPSPVGYSLPASNAFSGFTTTGSYTRNPVEWNVKGNFDKGLYFYTKPNKKGNNTIYFSASGIRNPDSGDIDKININSTSWSAGVEYNVNRTKHLFFDHGIIYPLGHNPRSWGQPVRSAEEKIKKYQSLTITV